MKICTLLICSDGDEDEDDEGISERSLRRSPSDDGKSIYTLSWKAREIHFYTFSFTRFRLLY